PCAIWKPANGPRRAIRIPRTTPDRNSTFLSGRRFFRGRSCVYPPPLSGALRSMAGPARSETLLWDSYLLTPRTEAGRHADSLGVRDDWRALLLRDAGLYLRAPVQGVLPALRPWHAHGRLHPLDYGQGRHPYRQ